MSLYPPSNDNNVTPKRLSKRISNGESPQDLLDELIDVLTPEDAVSRFKNRPRDYALANLNDILLLLIKHGAKIATEEKGCDFERIFCSNDLGFTSPSIQLMEGLLETPGEIPLHILAKIVPHKLKTILESEDACSITRHIQKRDIHGRTASHYLWAPDGQLAEYARRFLRAPAEKVFEKEQFERLHGRVMTTVWLTQELLQDLGAGIEIEDNQGAAALDLCNDRIKEEHTFMFPYRICRLVESLNSERFLSCSTPPAAARPVIVRL